MKNDVKKFKDVLKAALGVPEADPSDEIAKLVNLAELARRDGLLALDKAAEGVEDPFFRRGLEMTADGVDPEEIQEILEGEIIALKERHKAGAKFFGDMGGFSPTLGIIGTVIGLIHVLANLSNPNVIGPAIGSAFTATLWGVSGGQPVVAPDLQQAQACLGARGAPQADDRRRAPGHPGRKQPAAHRRSTPVLSPTPVHAPPRGERRRKRHETAPGGPRRPRRRRRPTRSGGC